MIMIEIIIDSRETLLFNSIITRDLDKYKDQIKISKEQLELGDIIIKFNDNIFIYERKTVKDLLSSLKDGRYNEQKLRLLSNHTNISYIIEGDDIISSKNGHNQNVLSSIYLHSIYRDKINIFFTKTTDETITFILIKSKKIDNIDKDTCYLLQLSQIPNISKEIAKKIKEKYPNIRTLLKALDDTDNKLGLLLEINKIGEFKAKKILEYFDYL